MRLALAALLGVLAGPAADEPVKVGFAVLGGFEYVEGMKLPAEVTRYHEKRVKISGFMQREDPGDGPVEFFMLINDACGCEGTPKINEIVFCAMPEGETTPVLPGIVTVTGTLYVQEEKEDGIVVAIYAFDAETVEQDKR